MNAATEKKQPSAVVAFSVVGSSRIAPASTDTSIEAPAAGRLTREHGLKLCTTVRRFRTAELELLSSLVLTLSAAQREALRGVELARVVDGPSAGGAEYIGDPRQPRIELDDRVFAREGTFEILSAVKEAVADRSRIDAIRARTAANLELDEAAEWLRMAGAEETAREAQLRYAAAVRYAKAADAAYAEVDRAG